MDVQVGPITFSSPSKSSAIVYVMEGERITTMPRANAEALYRTLIAHGNHASIDPPKRSFPNNQGLGGVRYGRHW